MTGLDVTVLRDATIAHDREHHEDFLGDAPDIECLADIKARYDARTLKGHTPGDLHIYRIVCDVCGQKGNVILTIEPQFTPDQAEPEPMGGWEPRS